MTMDNNNPEQSVQPVVPEASRAKPKRVFVFDNREFDDPDPSLTIEEVQKLLSDFAPELSNAEVKQQEKDGVLYIRFDKKIGTKG
jgi:PRTRC genetic system protein C